MTKINPDLNKYVDSNQLKYLQIDFNEKDAIKILDYTESGRVKTIKFGNIQIAGNEARTILGLKSTNFTAKIDNDNIIFKVIGYGHGVGMSQYGAEAMALNGYNYIDILKHYYQGIEIKKF